MTYTVFGGTLNLAQSQSAAAAATTATNEYQPKGGDALQLGSKGRYGSCVGGR